ncbi:MAG: thioesterase family protein [Planctomycetota bacterium]
MAYEYRAERTIEFAETDMAGIVHFSNYFRFMEATEHYFFRSLGLRLHQEVNGVMHGWVRVHVECDYVSPLRYLDRVAMRLVVVEKREKVLRHAVLFQRIGEDGELGPETARGAMTVVHVMRDRPGGELKAAPMPPEVDAALDAAPAELRHELKLK